MPRCQTCGEEIHDELAFSCNYCSETFCKDHRLPESHECLGLVRGQAVAHSNRVDRKQTENRSAGSSVKKAESEKSGRHDHRSKNRISGITLHDKMKTVRTILRRFYTLLRFPFIFPARTLSYVFVGGLMTFGSLVLIASMGGIGVPFIDEPATGVGDKTNEVLNSTAERADDIDLSSDRPSDAELEAAIHREVNTVRIEHGRQSLEHSENLQEVARGHSVHMAEEDFFAHDNPDGVGPQGRVNQAGLTCSAGENLYYEDGYSTLDPEETAERVVSGLMESPGHRENILLRGWIVEGIGVERRAGELYVTQKFCR